MTYFFIASLFNLIFYTLTSFISNLTKITNFILKIISNIHNNQRFADRYTSYKVFGGRLFSKLNLQKKSFTFYQKVKVKIYLNNRNNKEILISNKRRGIKENKKTRLIDANMYLFEIFKFNFFNNKNIELIQK